MGSHLLGVTGAGAGSRCLRARPRAHWPRGAPWRTLPEAAALPALERKLGPCSCRKPPAKGQGLAPQLPHTRGVSPPKHGTEDPALDFYEVTLLICTRTEKHSFVGLVIAASTWFCS